MLSLFLLSMEIFKEHLTEVTQEVAFVPPTGYAGLGTGGDYSFHTEFVLAEYFDENSEDSVSFTPGRNYLANDSITIGSASTGDSILYVTTTNLYYNDTVYYTPSLTENRVLVRNKRNGQNVLLGNFDYTHSTGSSQNDPPIINDTLLVQFPSGTDSVIVDSIGSYNWYFASHAPTGKSIQIGLDTVTYNVPWDTVRVQDPYQSWFVMHIPKDGGELWATRNALRFSAVDQQWVQIADGVGNGDIDIEFSRDLNHCYVATSQRVHRIDGLGSIYTSDPDFRTKAGYSGAGNPGSDAPTDITINTVRTGGNNGIALNPADPDDLIIFPVGNLTEMVRSSNATSASPTFTDLGAISVPSPFMYDGIIDRLDDDKLVVGTSSGVFTSDDGGATWQIAGGGFDGTPVFEIRQSWRTFEEGNQRPGEIFVGTFGRGIWSSASLLGLEDGEGNSNLAKAISQKMIAFPNPTNASTSIQFELAQGGNVEFKVYSISGTLKKSVSKNYLSAGKNQVDLEISDLAKGVYIVKMNSGKQTLSTKFVKM